MGGQGCEVEGDVKGLESSGGEGQGIGVVG